MGHFSRGKARQDPRNRSYLGVGATQHRGKGRVAREVGYARHAPSPHRRQSVVRRVAGPRQCLCVCRRSAPQSRRVASTPQSGAFRRPRRSPGESPPQRLGRHSARGAGTTCGGPPESWLLAGCFPVARAKFGSATKAALPQPAIMNRLRSIFIPPGIVICEPKDHFGELE
ncbi:MAG: hypothetical protein ACI82F_004292 [Planctomycetota bacterium]|jgi:hypothetical protein